jgi:hypothetical protein
LSRITSRNFDMFPRYGAASAGRLPLSNAAVFALASAGNKSGGSGEGVFYTHTCDHLSRVQIFREDPNGATLKSRCHNESIPKSDLGFILDSKRS